MCSEQIIDYVVKFATIVIAFMAMWSGFRWLEWWRKPKLAILFDQQNGMDVNNINEIVYIRGRVMNSGKSPAKNVEVVLSELLRRESEGFVQVDGFLPINLPWTHSRNPETRIIEQLNPYYLESISPQMPKYFDIAYHDSGTPDRSGYTHGACFHFDLITKPKSCFWNIKLGEYQFEVTVSSSTLAKATSQKFYLNLKQFWDPPGIESGNNFDNCFEIKKI